MMAQQRALMDTQDCVDYVLAQPLSYLVAAQHGAVALKASGEWDEDDQRNLDFLEAIINFRLSEGLTQ